MGNVSTQLGWRYRVVGITCSFRLLGLISVFFLKMDPLVPKLRA